MWTLPSWKASARPGAEVGSKKKKKKKKKGFLKCFTKRSRLHSFWNILLFYPRASQSNIAVGRCFRSPLSGKLLNGT